MHLISERPSHRAGRFPVLIAAAAAAILGPALLAGPASAGAAPAAVMTVSCGNVYGPHGLVADIKAANASGAPATISLARNCTYPLTKAFPALCCTIRDADGLPSVTRRLTLDGNGTATTPGATITRSAAAGTPQFRILEVAPGAVVQLNQINITHGLNAGIAGGIYNSQGAQLGMNDSALLANVSLQGSAGGLANFGTAALTSDTRIEGNISETANSGFGAFGGGLENDGTLTVTSGFINNNVVTALTGSRGQAEGGGISNLGTMTLTRTTVDGNIVETDTPGGLAGGGGIQNDKFNSAGRAILRHVDISGNALTAPAGGTTHGGGIIIEGGTVTDSRGTITRNNASPAGGTLAGGGGIFLSGGAITLSHTPVTSNTPDNCEPTATIPGCAG